MKILFQSFSRKFSATKILKYLYKRTSVCVVFLCCMHVCLCVCLHVCLCVAIAPFPFLVTGEPFSGNYIDGDDTEGDDDNDDGSKDNNFN